MKKTLTILAGLLAFSGIFAQNVDADFFRDHPDEVGGIYYTYRYAPSEMTAVPKGYKPFYISYVGRHGSRWHTSGYRYVVCQYVLNAASDADGLTDYGKTLQERMDRLANRAAGREAEISPQGINEQRGIAERMTEAYPELFKGKGKGKYVEAYSSIYPRCILTMTAFTQRLTELNPKMRIYQTTNDRVQPFVNSWVGKKSFADEVKGITLKRINAEIDRISPEVLSRIFKSGYTPFTADEADKCNVFVRSLFDLMMMMQDTEGDDRIDDLFTPEQKYAVWKEILPYRYGQYGTTYRWGDAIFADGAACMKSIVEDVDAKLKGENSKFAYVGTSDFPLLADPDYEGLDRVAFLRFGHDYTVIALLATMMVEGKCARTDDFENLQDYWLDFVVSPMSSNLQFVFFKNNDDEVLVKLLHNEQECRVPVPGEDGPYYSWNALREYMVARIAEVSELPAVKALDLDKPHKVTAPAFGELDSWY